MPQDSGIRVEFIREHPPDDIDEDTATICAAVIDVLSRVGYRRATIARMGRAAGRSGSRLIQRYRDKAHLVAFAAHERVVTPEELWSNFAAAEAVVGPRYGRALWVSDVTRPENARYWALNLELARVAQVVPDLAAFRVDIAPHGHVNLGVMLVASFAPDIHELPYAGPFNSGFVTATP